MKRIFGILIAVMMVITLTATIVGAQQEISVKVNGEKVDFDVKPQIINSRTMVPLRAIFEALGANVEWDDATKTVKSQKGDITIELTIGAKEIKKNGQAITLDVPGQIVNSRTLVPVRAISEAYGCDVQWDDATKTVIIVSAEDAESVPTKEQEQKEQDTRDSKELACFTSVSKSVMSFGKNYRIAFSVTVEGKGGEGNYKYRYELYQNGKISKKCSYSKENTFEGNLTGEGECIIKVYVKDNAGTEISESVKLTE